MKSRTNRKFLSDSLQVRFIGACTLKAEYRVLLDAMGRGGANRRRGWGMRRDPATCPDRRALDPS